MTGHKPGHPDEDTLFMVAHELASEEDLGTALHHLRTCPSCAESFRHLVMVRERARTDVAPSPALVAAAGVSRGRRLRTWRRPLVAVAATAAVVLLVVGVMPDRRDDSVATAFWLDTAVTSEAKRSISPLPPAGLEAALALYGDHRLDEAVTALDALAAEGAWRDVRDVYLFSALTNAGRYREAERVFGRLDVPTLPYGFRLAARWCHYVVLDGTGRELAARRQLDALRSVTGPVGERARAAWAQASAAAQGSPNRTKPDQ